MHVRMFFYECMYAFVYVYIMYVLIFVCAVVYLCVRKRGQSLINVCELVSRMRSPHCYYCDLMSDCARFRSMGPMYYRGAAAAIVVFDITSEESFTQLHQWVDGPPPPSRWAASVPGGRVNRGVEGGAKSVYDT